MKLFRKLSQPSLFVSIVLLIVAMQFSCKQTAFINAGSTDETTEEIQPGSEDLSESSEGEDVDIPKNITASYMACSLRQQAQLPGDSSQVGCRMQDETSSKTDLASIDESVSWVVVPGENTVVTKQAASSPWHVLIDYTGETPQFITERMAASQVQFIYNVPNSSRSITIESSLTESL